MVRKTPETSVATPDAAPGPPGSGSRLPATAHGRRTRAAIVEAAATMMYERGVAATSLDDILAASGTGKSQLYHYFKDRSELVTAVLERQTERILQAQPTLAQIDSIEGVEQWAEALLAMHEVPDGPFACPLGSMASELKNDPAYRPVLAASFGRWQSLLADGLTRMQDRGDLSRRDDPQRLATTVIAALQGGMLLGRVTQDSAVLRDILTLAVDDIRRRVKV
ncbi:MAG: TetR/AcrR family transcriptional regulator [Mycobacterium sp.]